MKSQDHFLSGGNILDKNGLHESEFSHNKKLPNFFELLFLSWSLFIKNIKFLGPLSAFFAVPFLFASFSNQTLSSISIVESASWLFSADNFNGLEGSAAWLLAVKAIALSFFIAAIIISGLLSSVLILAFSQSLYFKTLEIVSRHKNHVYFSDFYPFVKEKVFGLLFVYLLMIALFLLGSVFFILPGIILGISFIFAPFVFLDKGTKGIKALWASKDLISDYELHIFSLILPLLALAAVLFVVLGKIPFVGAFLSYFVCFVLIINSLYVLYVKLKKDKK